jgi:hypothetical protein
MLVGISGLFTSSSGPDEPEKCPYSFGFGKLAYGGLVQNQFLQRDKMSIAVKS